MKLNSQWFDKIRISRDGAPKVAPKAVTCQKEGCSHPGLYRAPQGRGSEGRYLFFCLDHVKEYNQSYNYFSGLPDDAVAAWQKDALTGHRPTWTMGVNGASADAAAATASFEDLMAAGKPVTDPFGFFGGHKRPKEEAAPARPVRNAERKAFLALDLDIRASAEDIRARYKELVKRFHPDANGGDRSLEDKLIEIIKAYNYLKSVGFC